MSNEIGLLIIFLVIPILIYFKNYKIYFLVYVGCSLFNLLLNANTLYLSFPVTIRHFVKTFMKDYLDTDEDKSKAICLVV